MTATAPAPTALPRRRAERRTVTTARVVAAEWTKLSGLRSTLWVALGTVGAAAGLALALGLLSRTDGTGPAALVVSGSVLAQLGALVLGVQVGAGEYGTGTFRTTFTAVPRRLPVLAGQVVVTTGVAVLTAVGALLASALVTWGQRGAGPFVADAGTARVLAGFVLYQAGVALLGLGAGALLRRPAAALVATVLLLVVLDQLLATNPGRVADTARALLPGAGARLVQDDARLAALDAASLGPHLGTWGGGLVLAAWVVVVLAAAAHRLRRYDVAASMGE